MNSLQLMSIEATKRAPRNESNPPVRPMSDQAARRWEETAVPFRCQYEGMAVREVPLSWLDKIVDPTLKGFKLTLARYLASPLVERERRAIDTENCSS